jgi:hypothetical protein
MRVASILLALVLMMGVVREARAWNMQYGDDFTIITEDHAIGIGDHYIDGEYFWTEVYARPLGYFKVLFKAKHGLFGLCVIITALVMAPTAYPIYSQAKPPST